MPYIDPNSDVVILKGVPLDANREHTIWFDTLNEQYNWFKSYQPPSRDGFNFYLANQSFIREHNESIRVGIPYKYLYDCNYLMFTNKSHENKRFFCFIDRCEYVNENVTIIHYSMDVIQSYMFAFVVKPCLVEREHTATDVLGENIVPEGLDVGEYVANKELKNSSGTTLNPNGHIQLKITTDIVYLVITSKWLEGLKVPAQPIPDIGDRQAGADCIAQPINGMYWGCGIYVAIDESTIGDVLYHMRGAHDSISAVCPFPASMINWNCAHWINAGIGSDVRYLRKVCRIYDTGAFKSIRNLSISDNVSFVDGEGDTHWVRNGMTIPKLSNKIDGYTPFNNKLFTAPFCWYEMTDNNGHAKPYRQELFSGSNVDFHFLSALSAEPKVMVYPYNYRNVLHNYEEGSVMSGAFPYCAWDYDNFQEWLTKNSTSLALAFAEGAAQSYTGIGSMATGKITQTDSISDTRLISESEAQRYGDQDGTTRFINTRHSGTSRSKNLNPYDQMQSGSSGFFKCAGVLAQISDHSMVSDSINGQINNGSINMTYGINDYMLYIKTVRADYAKKIDEYFSRFGYAVNEIKLPNFFDPNGHKRPRWNYLKTANAKVECEQGNYFNNNIEEAIENILNRGITFWNKNVDIYDYTQTSSVNNKPTP